MESQKIGNTLNKISRGDFREWTTEEPCFADVISIVEKKYEAFLVLNADLTVLAASKNFYNLFKVTPDETLGRFVHELGHGQWDIPALLQLLENIIPKKTKFESFLIEHEFPTIGHKIIRLHASRIYLKDGKKQMILLAFEDVTESRQAQEELRKADERAKEVNLESQDMYLDILESLPGILFILYIVDLPEHRLVFSNSEIARVLGYSHDKIRQWGASWPDKVVHPEDRAKIEEKEKRYYAASNGEIIETEIRMKHADGEWRWISCRDIVFTRTSEGLPKLILCACYDITTQKHTAEEEISRLYNDLTRMNEEIRHLAYHDELTGLPNRRLFTSLLSLELAQSARYEKKMAIFCLDIDRFKDVNDTLGHDVGDELLKAVAGRLKGAVRESDLVARIGGDEFNIILSNVDDVKDAAEIARKIVECCQKNFVMAGHEIHVTTSIGIGIYPDDSEDIDTLLKYADIAMYHAKKEGRNTYRFYNNEINVMVIERSTLYPVLCQAVERGELSVNYQPIIDSKTKKIVRAEALVRWQNADMGPLDAESFIPVAEETGLITSIDESVLRTACAQVASWKDAALPPFSVTVNLSARQFNSPELVDKVSHIIDETGIPSDRLYLEITESIAMTNIGRTAATMKELAARGLHISIDHFGIGYSALNYLMQLPVELLKIDKSIIQEMTTDSYKMAFMNAVIAMAYHMKMKVIAAGVETEEQLAFLRLAGCDEMQGFLFGRPMPAKEFEELIAAGK